MRPFSLEEAKAGKPLVTRDGRDAKFIAHVPECIITNRVIAHISGKSVVYDYSEEGMYVGGDNNSAEDLFMKTVKKTCYFNLWISNEGTTHWTILPTPEAARQSIQVIKGVQEVAIAVPIEIEE